MSAHPASALYHYNAATGQTYRYDPDNTHPPERARLRDIYASIPYPHYYDDREDPQP